MQASVLAHVLVTHVADHYARSRPDRPMRRLERARSLLLATRRSVPEVAFEVGYSSIGHFRRLLRRHLGVLPSELRSGTPTRRSPQHRTIRPSVDGSLDVIVGRLGTERRRTAGTWSCPAGRSPTSSRPPPMLQRCLTCTRVPWVTSGCVRVRGTVWRRLRRARRSVRTERRRVVPQHRDGGAVLRRCGWRRGADPASHRRHGAVLARRRAGHGPGGRSRRPRRHVL